jgi:hypothetical protein
MINNDQTSNIGPKNEHGYTEPMIVDPVSPSKLPEDASGRNYYVSID